MPPDAEEESNCAAADEGNNNNKQSLIIIRHGDRWDYENPEWVKTAKRPCDPPLSTLGLQQARETGVFLDNLLSSEGIDAENITWMSSPFLRCLQTSNSAIDSLKKIDRKKIQILPEYSIFEWDGVNGKFHASLPPINEREHYFPRLNMDYNSMFIPEIPEPRNKFHDRCQRVVKSINTRYPFIAGTALIAVTHAAGCIGITAAAANKSLADITPSAPCSIYRLSRTSSTQDIWTLDDHDCTNSLNGHTAHLSDIGKSTVPWNHFNDKSFFRGYSGPPTSRFAPDGYADAIKGK